MSGRDFHNTIEVSHNTQKHPAVSVATVAVTDRAGYGAIEFIVTKSANTATTATINVKLQSGTATSAHTLATTAEMMGTQNVTMTATTQDMVKMGYIGSDRYVSVRLDPGQTNATGAWAVIVLRGSPIKQPKTTGATG